MITYIDSENRQEYLKYTVLFGNASVKLGLLPFDKEVGLDEDLEPIVEKWMYYEDNGWKTRKCIPYDPTEGADNSLADFNENGEFLVKKISVDEEGHRTETKVVSNGISSLNDYFQHIKELAALAIGEGRSGSDPYFLRLPLNEPYFEINANTRGITVPGELSQIGIVGDKLAEIVFFRIDRYFDAIDLDTRHIYIEWEAPDGQGGVRRGISRDFLRDTQSEKDKIIFGWAIGEELTKYIGTIRFAVRFVEWSDNGDTSNAPSEGTGLQYSFSSLPATVSISDSLHYTLFEDDEDFEFISENTDTMAANLLNYIENSAPDSADETTVAEAWPAIFLRNLDKAGGENATRNAELSQKSGREVYVHNLFGGGKDEPHGTLELMAEAYSRDSGTINYLFGYKSYIRTEEGQNDAGTEGVTTKTKYIKVAFGVPEENQTQSDVAYLDAPNANTVYYEKMEDNIYEAVIEPQNGVVYYERVAYAIVDKAGYYHVTARNRVSGLKESRSTSHTLYVPYAAMPEVTEEVEPSFVISKVNYTEVVDTDLDQSLVENWTKSNITYEPSLAGDSSLVIGPTVIASDASAPGSTANFSYQWYKSEDNHDTEMVNAQPIEGATNATYEVTSEGCYAVKVENHFNNDETETELLDSGVCRVTNMPEAPVAINWDYFTKTIVANHNVQDILIEKPVDFDTVGFEWHMVTEDREADDVAEGFFQANAPVQGTLSFREETVTLYDKENDREYTAVRNVGHIPFAPSKAAVFYLVLYNQLNGAEIKINLAKDSKYGVIAVTAE